MYSVRRAFFFFFNELTMSTFRIVLPASRFCRLNMMKSLLLCPSWTLQVLTTLLSACRPQHVWSLGVHGVSRGLSRF